MKSGFRGVLSAAGIMGLCLVALVAVPASAAPAAFGAKLTTSTQPQGARSCHSLAPGQIPAGGVCTWVAGVAFENGSHFTAPLTGTLHHLKLVTCNAGKFTLQLVKRSANGRYKVGVTDNQVIHYVADPRGLDNCGGPNGDDYLIQTFSIKLAVQKGEYIAVKTARLGTIHCSGDNMPVYFPALATGQSFRATTHGAGCGMLVRVIY